MFIESIMNNHTINFDSWYTERNLSNNGRELQVDIGSAQHITSPKYLKGAFETDGRIGTPNKANNPTTFDNNHFRKYIVEIDGACYSRDGFV